MQTDAIYLWDVITGERKKTITGDTDSVFSVAFSPDGRTLASGGRNDRIRLWDVITGKRKQTLTGHTDSVLSIAFSPDGRTLASGSWDKTIRLWDVITGEHKQTLTGHTNRVRSVAFSPDGRTLASGSSDATIRLWDAITGKHEQTLTEHSGGIVEVAFSPDGQTLASGGGGTVFLWEFTPSANATVSVLPSHMPSPAIGEQFTVSLKIADGENVAGYQATVVFDPSALRYVESSYGDYLPQGTFFVPPVVGHNFVTLAATTPTGVNGSGMLATLTFEVVTIKASTLILSQVNLANPKEEVSFPYVFGAQVTAPPQPLGDVHPSGDVNRDGVVDILDLMYVGSNFGKTGRNDADVNGDGIVNIVDLVEVAGALGNAGAAPSVYSQTIAMPTSTEVYSWITQAQELDHTDATFQRGIIFLEQLLAVLLPKETLLLPNYPNPFNPETWIPYHLSHAADVRLTIYDAKGVVVRQLDIGHQSAGYYTTRIKAAYWDGRNNLGEPAGSGIYFYQLRIALNPNVIGVGNSLSENGARGFSAMRKMVILK